MKTDNPVFLLCGLLLAALGLPGCGGSTCSDNVGGINNIRSISISPTSVTMQVNTEADFTATANLANSDCATNTSVSWQVNGITGGNSTVGTITSLSTDVNVGVYKGPSTVPTTNNGQVTITAVITLGSSTGSSSKTITSNSATVTIGVEQGLAVTPIQATVGAGANYQFTAKLNNATDGAATWSVSSASGGDLGSINASTGLYTAPNSPPPGGEVTITATDTTTGTTLTAASTAKIVFSNASFRGAFAFSYTGNNQTGFFSVAGSFVADGNGHILSGIQDANGFSIGVSTPIPITGGTYQVGGDGRGTAIINTTSGNQTWRFALTTNQHAVMNRFDKNFTGSGTLDEQNPGDLSSLAQGAYVFRLFGADLKFHPLGIAGRFSADGAGNILAANAILDVNDAGSVNSPDTSLRGTYAFDATDPNTGRGTLTINSNTTNQLRFAFYIVDGNQLHLVEIDGNDYLAGEMFSGLTGSSFSTASLSSGNFVFTVGGISATGAYSAGGVFTSDGGGNITGGALDTNNAGTTALNATLSSCPYTVDSSTGRIDLRLCTSSSISEFAVYQTSLGTAVMLEIDSNAISTGVAHQQTSAQALSTGSYTLSLSGNGVFHSAPSYYQQSVDGEFPLSGLSVVSGNLDINNYNAAYASDPFGTTGNSVGTPSSAGRGTAVLNGTDPEVTYNLVYYVVDGSTALLLDQDKTFVLTGMVAKQF